jgi:hypothetical protein
MRWLALPAHVTMKTRFFGVELAADPKRTQSVGHVLFLALVNRWFFIKVSRTKLKN